MAEVSPKEKSKNVRELWKLYHVEGDKVSLKNKTCPKCDKAVLLAEHKNRLTCGKCGYVEFKSKEE